MTGTGGHLRLILFIELNRGRPRGRRGVVNEDERSEPIEGARCQGLSSLGLSASRVSRSSKATPGQVQAPQRVPSRLCESHRRRRAMRRREVSGRCGRGSASSSVRVGTDDACSQRGRIREERSRQDRWAEDRAWTVSWMSMNRIDQYRSWLGKLVRDQKNPPTSRRRWRAR